MAKVLEKVIWPAAVVEAVAVVFTGAYLALRDRPASAGPVSCAASSPEPVVTGEKGQADEPIVCTMRGDIYYHRRSCRYVRSGRIATPLTRARVHHRPCRRCKPPR